MLADRAAHIRKPASDFRSQKETISQIDCSHKLAKVTPYIKTKIVRIRYGKLAHTVTAASSDFAFKVAAKPLQIET